MFGCVELVAIRYVLVEVLIMIFNTFNCEINVVFVSLTGSSN